MTCSVINDFFLLKKKEISFNFFNSIDSATILHDLFNTKFIMLEHYLQMKIFKNF